ncbi:hypothetical protein TRAPUB_3753 [Trametes pubescens]|uniref:Uncharacterized protein n=1 Tax=Trametes pubescens TaxID=154538 RepID=A0A1M2VD24_TRAPU|nr:hypothetical protein TRAPUB_3753 [Trametes pubescens]
MQSKQFYAIIVAFMYVLGVTTMSSAAPTPNAFVVEAPLLRRAPAALDAAAHGQKPQA